MSRKPTAFLAEPWLVPLPVEARDLDGPVALTGGGAWPSANRALYIPFTLPATVFLKTIGFLSTSASGNYDLGIYDGTSLAKLVASGATAVGSNVNTYTLTVPLLLEADKLYYVGMSCSATQQMVRWSVAADSLRLSGAMQEASAHPLPASITGAAPANAYCPGIIFTFVR